MKCKTILLLLFAFIFVNINYAQNYASKELIQDLHLLSQQAREIASSKLLKTYQKSPKSKWAKKVEKISLGFTKKEIQNLFNPQKLEPLFHIGFGRTHSVQYELDNDWMLECSFQNEIDTIIQWELKEHTKSIWVNPPNDFSGKWITYYVNGQKAREIDYLNGVYNGKFVAFHSDGSKSYIQHYTKKGCHGMDTGYYPSGKIKYQGMYQNGKQCGTWNWCDEDGKIISTRNETQCKSEK